MASDYYQHMSHSLRRKNLKNDDTMKVLIFTKASIFQHRKQSMLSEGTSTNFASIYQP